MRAGNQSGPRVAGNPRVSETHVLTLSGGSRQNMVRTTLLTGGLKQKEKILTAEKNQAKQVMVASRFQKVQAYAACVTNTSGGTCKLQLLCSSSGPCTSKGIANSMMTTTNSMSSRSRSTATNAFDTVCVSFPTCWKLQENCGPPVHVRHAPWAPRAGLFPDNCSMHQAGMTSG